jgi:hypothetical protein
MTDKVDEAIIDALQIQNKWILTVFIALVIFLIILLVGSCGVSCGVKVQSEPTNKIPIATARSLRNEADIKDIKNVIVFEIVPALNRIEAGSISKAAIIDQLGCGECHG